MVEKIHFCPNCLKVSPTEKCEVCGQPTQEFELPDT